MKALFIGGTGAISAAAARLACQRGWQVTLLNRGSRPTPEGMRAIRADIRDEAAAAAALGRETFDVVAQFVGYDADDARRDVRLFGGRTGQYLFISSASAYQKPMADAVITESTPLVNPYWAYSRRKAQAEAVLLDACRDGRLPVTIVRPSHTYDGTRVPLCLHGRHGSWQTLRRMLDGRAVLIPGDGTSLWTMTHASDFAKGFVGLMGNPHALGQAYHITSDERMTWDQIYATVAGALGCTLRPVHVASEFLARHSGPYDLTGSLLGDKAVSVCFDNRKIKRAVPDFVCTVPMAQGLRQAVAYMLAHPETQTEDPEFDAWCERILRACRAADAEFDREG